MMVILIGPLLLPVSHDHMSRQERSHTPHKSTLCQSNPRANTHNVLGKTSRIVYWNFSLLEIFFKKLKKKKDSASVKTTQE